MLVLCLACLLGRRCEEQNKGDNAGEEAGAQEAVAEVGGCFGQWTLHGRLNTPPLESVVLHKSAPLHENIQKDSYGEECYGQSANNVYNWFHD